MPSLSYPAWMPKPLQSGFSMQPEDRRIASSTVGTSFQPSFGGDVCIAEVSLKLNRLQAHWLEQFERDVLAQGSRWFLFPLWYAGEVHQERCRFKTRPKITAVSGSYATYAFSLYVAGRDLMDERVMALLSIFYFDDIIYITNKLHRILHVQSPGLTILPDKWRLRTNG